MPDPRNLGTLFLDTVRRLPDKKAVLAKSGGRYEGQTWKAFAGGVSRAFRLLGEHGVGPGDRVAILSENRPEWALIDLAAQCLGAATVPIYTSLTPSEIRHILDDSGAKLAAVSNRALFEKIAEVRKTLPALRALVVFETALATENVGLPVAVLRGDGEGPEDLAALEASAARVDSSAAASLIYTSGTTGIPKGVVLTHANFIHNVLASGKTLEMGETDVHLSFLPLCHVFERMAGYYLMVHIGATIAYAESMDTVPQNLLEVRPTFILGVPRFFEKILARVLEAVKAGSPVKKALFFWAKELGEKRRLAGFPPMRWQDRLADALVYRKFRARLGGRVRFCVSGGAPLAREIAEFFADLGVMIYEGYGLTETSPVISVNREGRFRFGTVGVPLDGVEVRITAEGEIATRSGSVMKGYWNRPSETAEVLKDGWFHTGDLGVIDKDGFLAITGRKKELIVTSGGKKVPTRAVEETLEKDPYILRCVLFGEGRKYLTALIVPNREKLLEYASAQKIAYRTYEELLAIDRVKRFLESRVEEASKELANYEKV
ncbi:MAG TPA: long-chain fatty acid--CoA ligase, partial [Candidatus Eisenbacteria bacterium]|nr:long-chain fatty acid--CoA ligase [Candidatus Eisenbacteria bacterium]